jgi:DUF971 family protein
MNSIILESIRLKSKEKLLILTFNNGQEFSLGFAYLRKHSPSAENRGHSNQPKPLPEVAESINILRVEPVGHYAVKFEFDDGHDSGIYTWEYLYKLCHQFKQ